MKKKKKPTVWAILILTCLLAAALPVLLSRSGDSYVFSVSKAPFDGLPELTISEGAPFTAAITEETRDSYLIRVDRRESASPAGEYRITLRDTKKADDSAVVVQYLQIWDNGFILDLNTGRFPGCGGVTLALTLYFFGCTAVLVTAFFRQRKYSPYSYNVIIYLGFGLFVFSLALIFLSYCVVILRDPTGVDMLSVYSSLKDSAAVYLLLSAPLILLVALGLILSNIALLRHESKSAAHLLAALLGFLLLGAEFLLIWLDRRLAVGMAHSPAQSIMNIFSAVFLYYECMLLGTIAAVLVSGRHIPTLPKEYLLVLGCGMRRDGTPTPLLRGRCDAAADSYDRQTAAGFPAPKLLCSGGRGADEPISEAQCMKNYLLTRGIPDEAILMEEASGDTFRNFQNSKELIADPEARIAFFTSSYHVFRSGIWARRAGLPRSVEGGGAGTKWYFWPNAFVKEFLGLLIHHRGKQLLLLGCTVLLYTLFSFLLP